MQNGARREARMVLDLINSITLRSRRGIGFAGDAICDAFGGFTSREVSGCWFDDTGKRVEDRGLEFSVAISNADWPAFRDLAIALASGQQTVYVVSPHGLAEILPVPAL